VASSQPRLPCVGEVSAAAVENLMESSAGAA